MGLILFLLQTAVVWGEGAYPIGTLVPAQALIAGMWAFFLVFMPYLDNKAGAGLATLRPALTTGEEVYARLRYQLTTLPAVPTLLASVGGVGFVVVVSEGLGKPESLEALAGSPISQAVIYLVYVSVWWVFGAFMYHTIHQLRMINLTYSKHTRVNLFRMTPLSAFSMLTAITAVSLAATTYSWYGLNPAMLHDPVALGIALPITLVALAAFAWPLYGVHRLLVQEKVRLLDESSLRLEAAIEGLHARVDSGDLQGVEELNYAISSLEMEQHALARIPTWPWQPETVRLLATALVLALVLLVAQVVLQFFTGR
jgi:hypothetical protein